MTYIPPFPYLTRLQFCALVAALVQQWMTQTIDLRETADDRELVSA